VSVYHQRTAIIHAADADTVEDERERLVRLLQDEGGAVEHLGQVEEILDGPNAGSFVQVVTYVKPVKYL